MTFNPPKVSVLLPVYRGARTLERAVDSIRAQTFEDWELILLDDGSGDDSFELCRQLATDDGRIRAERHVQNRGLGAAMTTLVGLARGSYLAVQEQDDVSMPRRLEIEARELDEHPELGLVSGVAEWVDAEGQRLRLFPGVLTGGGYPADPAEMVRFLMLEQCKIVNAGCMFRRRVLADDAIFFDEEARMSVDWQFFLRLAHRYPVRGLGEIVVRMERGASRDSLTAQKTLQFREARRCLAKILADFEDDPSSPVDRRLYRRAMATQLLLEGRYWGGYRGARRHLEALVRDPGRGEIWRSLAQLGGSGLRKLARPLGKVNRGAARGQTGTTSRRDSP